MQIPDRGQLAAFIRSEERHLLTDALQPAYGNEAEFNAVFGVCAQAIRYAAAHVALFELGMPREAVVLARQALEHGVTAQWAHFVEGGLTQLMATLEQTQYDFYGKMATWLEDRNLADEIRDRIEAAGELGADLPSVVQRLRAFDSFLEIAYSQQSQFVHVTGTSTLGLLDLDDHRLTLRKDATDPYAPNTIYLAAMSTMFASWLLQELSLARTRMTELEALSDELQLPLTVVS